MEWAKHGSKFVDRLTDILAGIFGAAIYHFLTEKKDRDGKVVLDKDNKPVMTLDPKKVRAQVPYFVLSRSDEGEFNALVANLDSGSQKNLEIQMGQIPNGPFRPGEVPPGLGNNQRSNVILNIVQSNERNPLLRDDKDPRIDTIKVLQELADIDDPAQWKRRAVAFKLMKENESDYLGAKLSEQASAEFHQAKQEWDSWITARAAEMDAWTGDMRTYLRTRPRGFVATLRRMFDLPWDMSAPGATTPTGQPYNNYTPFGRRL